MTDTAHVVDVRERPPGGPLLSKAAIRDLRVGGDGGTSLAIRRRCFQLVLGVIWLADAALQYQPFMFTKGLATGIMEPTAQGNPAPIAASITWMSHLIAHHPALDNAAFATIQLAIAAGLFYRPMVKAALATSVAWAVGVWWFAEGFGGVLTGASPLSGAPGAVILYAFIAVLAWPRAEPDTHSVSVAEGSPITSVGARAGWVLLWASSAYLLLLPANRAAGGISRLIGGMATGEPTPIGSLDHDLASLVGRHGLAMSVGLAAACVVVALAVLAPTASRPGVAVRRAGLVVAGVLAAAFWVAENFGGILTGQGTDVNSGPLLAVLAATFWPRRVRVGRPSSGEVDR
jgi:hypothetical protein